MYMQYEVIRKGGNTLICMQIGGKTRKKFQKNCKYFAAGFFLFVHCLGMVVHTLGGFRYFSVILSVSTSCKTTLHYISLISIVSFLFINMFSLHKHSPPLICYEIHILVSWLSLFTIVCILSLSLSKSTPIEQIKAPLNKNKTSKSAAPLPGVP